MPSLTKWMIRRGATRARAAAADADVARNGILNPEARADRDRNLRRLIDMPRKLYRLVSKVK